MGGSKGGKEKMEGGREESWRVGVWVDGREGGGALPQGTAPRYPRDRLHATPGTGSTLPQGPAPSYPR